MRIQIDVDGEKQIALAFGSIAKDISDLKPFWDKVVTEFHKIEAKAFASEGASGESGKWVALKPAYAKIKAKKWGNVPILTASGRLRQSLTSQTGDSIIQKETDALTVGSTVPYGRYHQTGTRKMPARPPISLTEQHLFEFVRILQRQFAERAKEQGL
jgi:phage gpG-like protein